MVSSVMARTEGDTLLKSFVSLFTSEDFFTELIRISLYPSDFGVLPTRQQTFVGYLQDFLKDLGATTKKINLQNSVLVNNYTKLIQTILTIREDRSGIINYKNVFSYVDFNNLPISSKKILQTSVEKPIDNSDEFKESVNNIVNVIQAYYEIDSIKSNLAMFDSFKSSISDGRLSVFEAMKVYKDHVINQYNDLSKLQTLNKKDDIVNWFVISDAKSCKALAKTIMNYISEGYNSFKTGIKLFDNNIQGFESSSVHLISAPLICGGI
jgi:hypothetical protein